MFTFINVSLCISVVLEWRLNWKHDHSQIKIILMFTINYKDSNYSMISRMCVHVKFFRYACSKQQQYADSSCLHLKTLLWKYKRGKRVKYFGACPCVEKQKSIHRKHLFKSPLTPQQPPHVSPFLSAGEQIPACCVCGHFVP